MGKRAAIREPGHGMTAGVVPGAEPRFRELAENVPSLVWTSGPDGVSDYLSPQWREYTGISEDELTGAARWELIHPEDRSAVVQAWVTSTTEGIPYDVQFRLRRHDGAWRWFQARSVPQRDEHGRIVRWFGTSTDIESQKQAEIRQRLLSEAAALLLAADDPNAMMQELFTQVSRDLDVDTYFNFMVDEKGEGLRLASCAGVSEETRRELERLEFGQAICGSLAASRKAIVATAIQDSDDPRVQLVKSLGIRTYACRPLMDEGRVIGTLSFASRNRDSFGEDELDFMRTITRYVEVAHQRLRLVHELKEADRRKD